MSGSAYVVLLAKALRQYAGVFIIFVIIKVFDSDRQHPLMEAVGIMGQAYLWTGCSLCVPGRGWSTVFWKCAVSCSIRSHPNLRKSS